MRLLAMIISAASTFVMTGQVRGDSLSIYEIQYTTDADGASPQDGNIVDCLGGIVTHKPSTGRPRLVVQDPNCPDGWGGIQVKDLFSTGVFADVNVGDRVSFTNVVVEESKNTTFLQYMADNEAGFTIVSTANPLPRPLRVEAGVIGAPVEGPDSWLVGDHVAERYESMLIKVVDVSVETVGYGKAYDNYALQSSVEPNDACWVSDYMNEDSAGIYHPQVELGRHFCGVVGILEQYAGNRDGIEYDYYQLLTRNSGDFVIDQTADFDKDCDVDNVDFCLFAQHWLQEGCLEPDWCGGADLTRGHPVGDVSAADLSEFARNWLAGR